MAGVLEGIRVLDFGRYIAGPYCATLLAEHGAEVIRIEKRDGSEDRFQAPVADTGDGALFLQINRNKLGLTLDPMVPEGQEIVRKLVATADVVIANLPPQTLSAMKLDYDSPEGGEARHHPHHRHRPTAAAAPTAIASASTASARSCRAPST